MTGLSTKKKVTRNTPTALPIIFSSRLDGKLYNYQYQKDYELPDKVSLFSGNRADHDN
jgi:hypothetical protein